MKDKDPTDMTLIDDLKTGYPPINLSHLEGGGFRRGEMVAISAISDIEKSKLITSDDVVVIDEASGYDIETDMLKPNDKMAKFRDVIVVGGHDSGLPHKYKLSDRCGDRGVITKLIDDNSSGFSGDASELLRYAENRIKKDIPIPRPVTLRNLFLNRR